MANNGNSIFEYLIINCGFFRFLLSLHELTYQFFKRCKEYIFHTTNVGDYRSVLLHPLLLRSNGRVSAMINDNRDTALIIGSTRSEDKTEEINGRGSSANDPPQLRCHVVLSSCCVWRETIIFISTYVSVDHTGKIFFASEAQLLKSYKLGSPATVISSPTPTFVD